MRNVMTQPSTEAMLEGFVEVFCRFWSSNRMLLRRIHGIGAIDPEFGTVIEARNGRRYNAAKRIVSRMGSGDLVERASALTALTSFEFFDALADNLRDEKRPAAIVLDLARKLLDG
jgi:hypothetical protein